MKKYIIFWVLGDTSSLNDLLILTCTQIKRLSINNLNLPSAACPQQPLGIKALFQKVFACSYSEFVMLLWVLNMYLEVWSSCFARTGQGLGPAWLWLLLWYPASVLPTPYSEWVGPSISHHWPLLGVSGKICFLSNSLCTISHGENAKV